MDEVPDEGFAEGSNDGLADGSLDEYEMGCNDSCDAGRLDISIVGEPLSLTNKQHNIHTSYQISATRYEVFSYSVDQVIKTTDNRFL